MISSQQTFGVKKIRLHSSRVAMESLEQRAVLSAGLPSVVAIEPMNALPAVKPTFVYRIPPGVLEPGPGSGDDKRGSDKPDDGPPPMDDDPPAR